MIRLDGKLSMKPKRGNMNRQVTVHPVLAVQASSAASERVFSIASRLIDPRCTRLDPDIAGMTLFVADNWEKFEKELNMKFLDVKLN